MRYSLHRLLLIQRIIPPILEESGQQHPEHSRQEYLKEVFGKIINFKNRNKPYAFAYIGEVGSIILGRVGRLKSVAIEEGPETGFAKKIEDRWHAANFLPDTRNHEDGQKVAIEEIPDVGSTLFLTRSMVDSINSTNAIAKWEIFVETITDKQEFWDVVEKHRGKITELELSFVAPNIFGGRDKTTERLRALKDENNMQTTSVKIHNNDGALNVDTEDVRQSVDIISEGGGKTKVMAEGKTVYNSEQRGRKVFIDGEENFPIGEENKSLWADLSRRLFQSD